MTKHLALADALKRAPKHWERRRFRYAARLRTEKNVQSNLPLLSLSSANGIQTRGEQGLGRQAPAEDSISSYWSVHPGDIVVNPMWVIEGGVATSSLTGAVSPAYRVYTPEPGVHPRFIHHLLRSRPYVEEYRQYVRGVTTFDRSVPKEDFADLPVLVPPLEEQLRIADFLDAETARMDVLTDAMARQIETLKQHRLRVLDRVMEGTENVVRVRLGYVVELVTSGSRAWSGYVAGSGRPFFRSANLCPDSVYPNLSSLVHVSLPSPTMSEATRSRIQRDDVLVGITGANAGWVALADDKVVGGHVSQHVCLVRPERRRIAGRWLAYIIASPTIQESLLGSQYGGTKTQLSLPDIRNLRVPIVPVEQQEKTVRDVEERIHLIDRQRRLRARQLDLLTERRTALITAAVTGEFDVSSASGRGVTE